MLLSHRWRSSSSHPVFDRKKPSSKFHLVTCLQPRFNVSFSGLDWVPNFEKTRWFLVLRLNQPELNGLNKLLYISNKVVQEYDQPTLYAKLPDFEDKIVRESMKPRMKVNRNARRGSESKTDWSDMVEVSDAFHISIAWTLERPSFQLLAATKSMVADGFEDVKKISFSEIGRASCRERV